MRRNTSHVKHTFQSWKVELDAGRITPMEALYRWTKVAVKETALNLKPYAEFIRETLPKVEWLKDGEHVIYMDSYIEWRSPKDFYQWADDYLGHVFSVGEFLREYINETDPARRDALVETIQEKAAKAAENPLPESRRPTKEEQANKVDIINLIQGGTNQTYTLRRLARDNPELLARVANGELSPNAAAIQAGFRRPMKSVPIDSPQAAINALLKVFSAEDLTTAIRELTEKGGESANNP